MSDECMDPDIRKMLKEKVDYEIRKHEQLAEKFGLKKSSEMLPKLRALGKVIDEAKKCEDILTYHEQVVAEPHKKTPRQEFMSFCMRSPAKGGEGKDMSTCSTGWRQKEGK